MREPSDHERKHDDAGQQPAQHLACRRLLDDRRGDAVFGRSSEQPESKQEGGARRIDRHGSERERVGVRRHAVRVAREHDQHLREQEDGQDLAEGGEYPPPLRVEQRQPEQDQRAGNAWSEPRRLLGGGGVRRDEGLLDAEVEAEHVLAQEDDKADRDKGERDEPREQAQAPEGEPE